MAPHKIRFRPRVDPKCIPAPGDCFRQAHRIGINRSGIPSRIAAKIKRLPDCGEKGQAQEEQGLAKQDRAHNYFGVAAAIGVGVAIGVAVGAPGCASMRK